MLQPSLMAECSALTAWRRPAARAEKTGWSLSDVVRWLAVTGSVHDVEHHSVLALDVLLPQMVDQLLDNEQFFRALSPEPEQVIEVPKILPCDVPMRTAVRVPQLAEQLVEVLTIISYSSLQRTVEQHVDIPVPGGEDQFWSSSFSSGRSSTVTPSSEKRFSERIVEHIVDPVSSGGLHGFLPGQGSSSSHSPAGVEERADEPGEMFFRTFPKIKKCEAGSALESEGARHCQLTHAGGSARADLWSHPVSLREPGGLAIPLS